MKTKQELHEKFARNFNILEITYLMFDLKLFYLKLKRVNRFENFTFKEKIIVRSETLNFRSLKLKYSHDRSEHTPKMNRTV